MSNVSTVDFVYNEFYIPLEINFNTTLAKDISVSFNNIIPIGINGLVKHIFDGPGGFTDLSYHNSLGYFSTIQLNYKRFSLGPWGSFTWYTRGKYNHHYTVPPGVELKVVEFGLKAGYTI